MRFLAAFVSGIGACVMAAAAWAAGLGDIEGCDQSADRERRMASCSRLIEDAAQSDTTRAVAYNNRGNALRAKGENVRAIADYNEAIRLRPAGIYYYNRGNAHRTAGDNARAIADYGAAIGLDRNDSAAYNNRGNAYRAEGDFDRAIVDFDTVIRLKPTARAFHNRGEAHRLRGDSAQAIADYSEAIRLEPKRARFHFDRGQAYLYGGAPAQAEADLTRANELDPKHPYGALWREIGERRNQSKSDLAQTAARVDMNAWPAPIIRLFLGETTAEAVLAAANDPDPGVREVRLCEARFYIGELSLLQQASAQADRMFRLVADECRRTVVEWESAKAELKASGMRP